MRMQLNNLTRLTCVTVLLVLTGCVTDYKPDMNVLSETTRAEKTDVRQLFLKANYLIKGFSHPGSISLVSEGFYVHDSKWIGNKSYVKWNDLDPKTDGFWFLDFVIPVGRCLVVLTNGKDHSYSTPTNGFNTGCGENEKKFISILVLIREAVKDDQQQFARALSFYRTSNPKPEANEEIRKFNILAINALQSNDIAAAERYYFQGTIVAPWWPLFHFNRALTLAELHEYSFAAIEMKRYLALVPDAMDARGAQDKIYIWEGLATK